MKPRYALRIRIYNLCLWQFLKMHVILLDIFYCLQMIARLYKFPKIFSKSDVSPTSRSLEIGISCALEIISYKFNTSFNIFCGFVFQSRNMIWYRIEWQIYQFDFCKIVFNLYFSTLNISEEFFKNLQKSDTFICTF